MSTAELEKRLAAVKQDVARLKSGKGVRPRHPVDALRGIHGILANDEATAEAARLGRKWRRAQRPLQRKKASRK